MANVPYDPAREILEDYREQCDELHDWWNRYEGGMISKNDMLDRVKDFIVWHCAMENKAI